MHEYMSPEHTELLLKTAEPEHKAKRIAKTVGSGLAGMGLGYLTGAGAAHVADKAFTKFQGRPIPSSAAMSALPALGAAGGLAYSLYKAQEMEEIRRALEDSNHQSAGRVPD